MPKPTPMPALPAPSGLPRPAPADHPAHFARWPVSSPLPRAEAASRRAPLPSRERGWGEGGEPRPWRSPPLPQPLPRQGGGGRIPNPLSASHPPVPGQQPAAPGAASLSRKGATALLAALAFAAALPAAAQTAPWTLSATQSFNRNTNLYRLPDGVQPGAGLTRGDWLSTTTLAAGLDQRIGRQRVLGEASLRALRHRDNERLDHEGYTLAAAWDWETIERLSGTLRAGSTRTLRPFDSFALAGATATTARNLETTDELAAVARLGGVGRLTLEAAAGMRRVGYSDPAYATSELRADTLALGARWRPAGGTVLGAAWRHTWGRYPVLGDRYHSDALDFTAEAQPSGPSRLYLRLSPARARYDGATERDYSGLTGAAQWRWQATGKLALALRAVRDLGQDAYLERYGADGVAAPRGSVDDSTVLTRLALEAEHALTAKVALTASAGVTRRDLARPGLPSLGQPAVLEGRDTTRSVVVGARWTPTRTATLGCEAGVEHRNASGTLSGAYRAATLACFGRIGWR
jgi:hypothetical protein